MASAGSGGACRRRLAVGRYLAFGLQAEEFAIDVAHVDGVVAYRPLHAVPATPADTCVRGAMFLAGQAIAVMDLRAHLGLSEAAPTDRTCIVIVAVPRGDARFRAGLIVDRVGDVIEIPPQHIQPLPERGRFENDYFIRAIARHTAASAGAQRERAVLDVGRVLGVPDDAGEERARIPITTQRRRAL